MSNIVKPISKRLAEAEALAQYASNHNEVVEAKADFVAMMCDVDLSMIEDDETEVAEDAQQEV